MKVILIESYKLKDLEILINERLENLGEFNTMVAITAVKVSIESTRYIACITFEESN